MKRLLWIGSYLTEDILKEISYKNAAAYLSQKNIHDGIEEITGQVFDSIGAVVLSDFQVRRFCRREFRHTASARDVLVGFWNIRYICKLSSRIHMVHEARAWLKNIDQQDEVEIYIYEMRSCCLAAAMAIKKRHANTKIHLIVPDLPAFMDLGMSPLKRFLKKIDWLDIQNKLYYVDDYILYAAPMAQYLGILDKQWMVMEGSINREDIHPHTQTERAATEEKCVVMYSGSVHYSFGLENLLKAFQHLDDRFELWITGSGTAKELVQEAAKQDKRIRYYGFLPTRADLLDLQSRATVMINMRKPDEPASNYCFPSKLFEYMLLGKPVLSCRLGGIPEEYSPYLVEMKSLKPEDVAEAIRGISMMSRQRREEMGSAARAFILREKTNIVQAKRILEFVNS